MATSVFSFTYTGPSSDEYTFAWDANFNPPSNIGGEHCYVECTMFTWDFSTSPTPALYSRDVFLCSVDWAQTVSGTVTTNGTRLGGVPFGSQMNNIFHGHGPVLCYIPEGPQTVRLSVTRPDGGQVTDSTSTDNTLFAVFKICPANSRQPTIGV